MLTLNFATVKKTLTGRRHICQGKTNQDHVQIHETDFVLSANNSDGCGECRLAAKAAHINSKAAAIIAENPEIWDMSEREFRRMAADVFTNQIEACGEPFDDLCATSAFVIIHKQTGEYIAFSVGDSAVLAVGENLVVRPLLKPVNGIRKTQTIFTNDDSAVRKLGRYSRGRISAAVSGFVLYTDGAERIAEMPFTDAQQLVSGMLISNRTAEQFADQYAQRLTEINADDITFAAVMLDNARTRAAADSVFSGRRLEDRVHTDGETERTIRAELPFCVIPRTDPEAIVRTKHADQPAPAVQQPRLLQYLQQPRTAEELVGAGFGLCRENFMSTVLTLLRLDLVTVSALPDGKVVFQNQLTF